MWYVLGEIWVWMVLAVILGITIGYFLGQLRQAESPTDRLEAELAAARAKVRQYEKAIEE